MNKYIDLTLSDIDALKYSKPNIKAVGFVEFDMLKELSFSSNGGIRKRINDIALCCAVGDIDMKVVHGEVKGVGQRNISYKIVGYIDEDGVIMLEFYEK